MSEAYLIFGGTGGVGSALTRRLRNAGKPVFITARDEGRLHDLAEETGASFAACDIMQPETIPAVVEQAASADGLAGLAYCVGSITLKPLKSLTAEDMIETFRRDVIGAAMAVKAALPALQKAKGAVVLFSTVAVQQGFANHAATAAAKGAIEGMVRSLAAEFAPNVRVNAVAPSLVETPLSAKLRSNPEMAKSIAGLHPIPRLGTPEDIAAAADYLLGPDSSWVTGQILHIDGGRSSLRTKG